MAAQLHLLDPLSTEHLEADLKGRSVRGGLLTITSQGAQFVLQSIGTVVLARLLTPADFGMVAMVTAVTALPTAFVDLGLTEATVQSKNINHEQVSTLFWVNVSMGLGLTVVVAGLAPLIAWFYKTAALKNISCLLALSFLISGLRSQHDALLKRQMRFLSLAIRDVAAYAIGIAVAVTMAWKGATYWALVALPLIINATQMLLSWMMVGWRPGRPHRDAGVGAMINFGGNVAASYFITAVNRSADNILIGWYWGAGPLGLYSRAYNLLMLPLRQLSGPAVSVAVPAFSRLQDDPERFARYYLRAVNLVMWIGAPVFGFLFVAAEPVIVLILGRQWRAAAPVFQCLAISALAQLLYESTLWLFLSSGRSDRLFKLLRIISPIIIGSFVVGLPFGIKGVALLGSVVMLVLIPVILKFSFRDTTLTLWRLAKAIFCPITLCGVAILLSKLVIHSISSVAIGTQLFVVFLSFAVSYLLSLILRTVREEIMAFRTLLIDLRLSRGAI